MIVSLLDARGDVIAATAISREQQVAIAEQLIDQAAAPYHGPAANDDAPTRH